MKSVIFLVMGLTSLCASAADYWFVEVTERDSGQFLALVPEESRVVVQKAAGVLLRPQIRPAQLFEGYVSTKYIIRMDDVSGLAQIPGLRLTRVNDIVTSFSAERVSDNNGWGEVSAGATVSRVELKVYEGSLTEDLVTSIRDALENPLAALENLYPAAFRSVSGPKPLTPSEAGFEVRVFFKVYLPGQDVYLFQTRVPYLKGSLDAFSAYATSGYLQTRTAVINTHGGAEPCESLVSPSGGPAEENAAI